MDKERLEETKQKYSNANIIEHINGIDIIAVDKADLDWFFSTVSELEEKAYYLSNSLFSERMEKDRARERYEMCKEENARLWKALERIKNYYPGVPNADLIPIEMLYEVYLIAQKALEGAKCDKEDNVIDRS